MQIEEYKNIKEYNTFMVPAVARYFACATDNESLYAILASDQWSRSEKHLVLGGGSNMLFIDNYDGFVLKNEIAGIDIVRESDVDITMRVGAGESWHDFVMWSVERGYWGIENLAYIPGTVGGAPVQNIGAYGVDVSSVIDSVEYVALPDAEKKIRFHDECEFGYRNSWFKKNIGTHIISHVYIILQKNGTPVLSYGKVAEVLREKNITQPTAQNIADVIIEIRQSKLPEVGEIGMAGSFFKNPVISRSGFDKLQNKIPDIKYFALDNGDIKIPAGWILDYLGYKGFQNGNAGNYKKHALVVTHNGQGTGAEVWSHVQDIIAKVQDEFGIVLEPEVNVIK
ncbi:MAG: UDP-N-acetylmuramate dehydrogenase [Minisyncoccia bacterium]